jgi:predicted permease
MRPYDLLLHLYPASFRNEYGGEMRVIFARRRRQATGVSVPLLWLNTVGEVAANALLVHLDILRQDLAYATRVLRRSPAFAATAVIIVALGIGATTAAFSVTDFVLIRPLPFPEPNLLVKVWEETPGYTNMELSPPNYRDWKAASKSFESMGIFSSQSVTITISGEPRRLLGSAVSADLFSTLGVAPVVGRTFTSDDDQEGHTGTVILSDQLWQAAFGGDRSVVGRPIILDNESYVVIGVMSREFHFPASDVQFWTTNRYGVRDYQDTERANDTLEAVGRLRHGVTIERARAEMRLIATDLERKYPKENKDTGAAIIPLGEEVSERSRLLLVALSGAALCVLMIACANLANLLLARALGRRRELAVRTAMGAGRERLVRQLMTESLVIAVAGGALGIGIALASVPLLARLVPSTLPIAAAPTVDLRVLLFATVLSAFTGVAFGVAPILRVSGRPDLDGLREGVRAGGGAKERLRSALVVAEITASVALLVCAGLLLRALVTVRGIDPGFNPRGVLTLRTELPMPEYRSVAARETLYTRVLDEVRALPGVTAAGYVSFLPMSSFRGGMWTVSVKGDAGASDTRSKNNVASIRYVTPGYVEAMGMPIKRGRDIGDGDNRDRQFAAVVSESFVRRYWPNDDPIGRHFTFAYADREVVGVVGDVRFRGLERVSEPQVYLSSKQVNDGAIVFYSPQALAIRTAGVPSSLASAVREIVRRADPRLPISDLQTLGDMVDLETESRVVQVRVIAAFAGIAFVLAAVGLHGLLSFAVSQRVNEIGLRVALGASSRTIVLMVLSRGLVLAVVGIVAGVLLAWAAGRSMEALLAGVQPADALTVASAVGLSFVMTLLGTLAPTLRALRVDPIVALKSE